MDTGCLSAMVASKSRPLRLNASLVPSFTNVASNMLFTTTCKTLEFFMPILKEFYFLGKSVRVWHDLFHYSFLMMHFVHISQM